MTISVTRRIHIAPQGYEDDRIYLPALELDADKVILLSHDDKDDRATRCRDKIIDELEAENIETNIKKCDIFDLNESLETLLCTIRSRPSDDDIKVNVSAGSKITAIAGMMACMFTDADSIYVVPEGYGEDTISYGMKDINGLPTYPVAEPDYQLIQVLDYIHEQQSINSSEGVLLKEIGEFLLENDLPAVEGSDKKPEQAEEIYPIIRREIIDPLSRHGLINERPLKGGVHIRTTQAGEEMLELGRSLINSTK